MRYQEINIIIIILIIITTLEAHSNVAIQHRKPDIVIDIAVAIMVEHKKLREVGDIHKKKPRECML